MGKLYTKLLGWLVVKSRDVYRNNHLDKYGWDIKCPACNIWFSISGIENRHNTLSRPDFGYHLECGNCGSDSYWNCVHAPVMLLCDGKGVPID